MDFPKMLYRGAYASLDDLQAAWQGGTVESCTVADLAAEVAAMEDGFVADPIALIGAEPVAAEVQEDGTVAPRKRGRPRKDA